MGQGFWSYGFEPNRHVLQRFLARHHAEGLSQRLAPTASGRNQLQFDD